MDSKQISHLEIILGGLFFCTFFVKKVLYFLLYMVLYICKLNKRKRGTYMNAELLKIVDELELKASNAKLKFNYLEANMYQNWIDQIKNCEVGLKEARQMLKASKLR